MIILYSFIVVFVIAILLGTTRLVSIEIDNIQNIIFKISLNIISIWLAWQNAKLEIRHKSYMIEDNSELKLMGREMIRLNRR